MIWILNMIVSVNLRRVSLGISANVPIIAAVADLKAQTFNFKTKVYE